MDVFTKLIELEDKTFLSVNFMVKALKVKQILITLYFMEQHSYSCVSQQKSLAPKELFTVLDFIVHKNRVTAIQTMDNIEASGRISILVILGVCVNLKACSLRQKLINVLRYHH